VNLPTAASAQKGLREHLGLAQMEDREMILDKEPITFQDLGPLVRIALPSELELMGIINPDGDVHHRAGVKVMDERRSAGVARLAIGARLGRKARP
jgi:biopolymer transport protein ExbD